MTTRSVKVWLHSGPNAPELYRCSQIVHAAAAAESTKKGASGKTSRQATRRAFHHPSSARATGSITVDGLLRMARVAQPSAAAYHRPRDTGSVFSRQRWWQRIAARKNTADCVFFSSQIQATDSACTGCSAQSAAPSHAPGTRSRSSTRHSSSAAPA